MTRAHPTMSPHYASLCLMRPQFGNEQHIQAKRLLDAAADCVEWVVDRLANMEPVECEIREPEDAKEVADLVEEACHEDPCSASGFIVPWSVISDIDWDVVGLVEAKCADLRNRQHAEAWQRYIVECIKNRWREA